MVPTRCDSRTENHHAVPLRQLRPRGTGDSYAGMASSSPLDIATGLDTVLAPESSCIHHYLRHPQTEADHAQAMANAIAMTEAEPW